jgi:hypothetical protein
MAVQHECRRRLVVLTYRLFVKKVGRHRRDPPCAPCVVPKGGDRVSTFLHNVAIQAMAGRPQRERERKTNCTHPDCDRWRATVTRLTSISTVMLPTNPNNLPFGTVTTTQKFWKQKKKCDHFFFLILFFFPRLALILISFCCNLLVIIHLTITHTSREQNLAN